MLTLTDTAAEAIRSVTEQPQLPEETGVRIAPQADGSGALALSLSAGPETGDQVVEAEGAKVYLAPAAATVLDHATLDAIYDGGELTFTLTGEPDAPRT